MYDDRLQNRQFAVWRWIDFTMILSRRQPPLALAVPVSRFTSLAGGGAAFFVRPYATRRLPKYYYERPAN